MMDQDSEASLKPVLRNLFNLQLHGTELWKLESTALKCIRDNIIAFT